ncbi:MAG TPA: hypothetical protein PLJ38_08955, partial [bacterium]|nr:hypothetical protein [bacterium]
TITVNYTILLDTQLYFNINDTLPSISAMQGAENISVLSFSLLSDTNFGTDMLQKITIKNIGNLTGDTAITNVKLYLDSDSNFKYSETDTFIDNLIWDPPYWLNTDLNYSYTLSGSNFVVAIDLSNNAAVGDTFQAMIPALSIKTQKTDTAPLTDTFASAVITVIQDTTPKIKITSPDNNYYTNLSVITISGTTLNTNAGDTIKIYTNSNLNTTVILSAMNGTWQGTAALTQTNVDTIVAVLFSNTYIRSDTIFVNYLSGSATIKILSPVTSGQRYDTSAAVITISGTTTDANNGDSIIILLNGETQSITLVSSNNWSSTTTVPVNSLQILTARFLYSGTIPVDDTIILAPGFLISGIVTLDGYQYDSGILVNLTGGISSAAAITSDTGFFRVAAISSDTYILTFSRAGYLSDAVQIFVDTDIYLGAITELKAGDYYKNGYINIRDAAILKRYYNQSNNEFDIDDNNIINYREKEYLIKNFER